MNNVLKNLATVYTVIKKSKNFDEATENIINICKEDAAGLAKYFQEGKVFELSLLSVLVVNGLEGSGYIKIRNIRNELKIEHMALWLIYLERIHALRNKEILISKPQDDESSEFMNNEIAINPKILNAIIQNKPYDYYLKMKKEFKDILDLFSYIDDICFDNERTYYRNRFKKPDNQKDTEEIVEKIIQLLQRHNHFPFIQFLLSLKLEAEDLILYVIIIWDFIRGKRRSSAQRILDSLGFSEVKTLRYVQRLRSGKNQLIEDNLIERQDSDEDEHPLFSLAAGDDLYFTLSEKSIEFLFEYEVIARDTKKKAKRFKHKNKNNIIPAGSIKEIKLFFPKKSATNIENIYEALNDERMKGIQARLEEQGMPKGICILFYGYPGTGKTESVKQIARKTGRDLYWVNLSETKSMWYGQTEKLVRKIFTDYQEYAETCEKTPILVLNEADALLSKRKEVDRSIDQTENTIQNIILEEMENFNGILIATTNMLLNLDKAFERRFLFKVEFMKPSMKIRAKIWQSKLSFLSQEDCEELAEKYEFSGGEIDNIAKKCIIYEVINGRKPNFFEIESFCEEEKWNADFYYI